MGSRRRLCSNLRTPRGSLRTTSLGWQFMMSLPLSSKQCCPAPVRNRRLPFVHSAFSLQREFPIVLWYSPMIKVSSGPYFVKPLGFWVVRLWKVPFSLAFGSHYYSCTPLFIRRTRTFRNPSCRTLFSSLATTPSSSSMMFSGILHPTTFCAVVLQILWRTSFQAGPPQCCCIKPERLDTETTMSNCSLDL